MLLEHMVTHYRRMTGENPSRELVIAWIMELGDRMFDDVSWQAGALCPFNTLAR